MRMKHEQKSENRIWFPFCGPYFLPRYRSTSLDIASSISLLPKWQLSECMRRMRRSFYLRSLFLFIFALWKQYLQVSKQKKNRYLWGIKAIIVLAKGQHFGNYFSKKRLLHSNYGRRAQLCSFRLCCHLRRKSCTIPRLAYAIWHPDAIWRVSCTRSKLRAQHMAWTTAKGLISDVKQTLPPTWKREDKVGREDKRTRSHALSVGCPQRHPPSVCSVCSPIWFCQSSPCGQRKDTYLHCK